MHRKTKKNQEQVKAGAAHLTGAKIWMNYSGSTTKKMKNYLYALDQASLIYPFVKNLACIYWSVSQKIVGQIFFVRVYALFRSRTAILVSWI